MQLRLVVDINGDTVGYTMSKEYDWGSRPIPRVGEVLNGLCGCDEEYTVENVEWHLDENFVVLRVYESGYDDAGVDFMRRELLEMQFDCDDKYEILDEEALPGGEKGQDSSDGKS